MILIDIRTDDGSRHFASLPGSAGWDALRDQILLLPDAKIVEFVTNKVAQGRIDFTYGGHLFSVTGHGGEFRFFVRDPQCSDVHLYRVGSHCEQLLGSG